MIPKKKCSSCTYFTSAKNNGKWRGFSGYCDFFDSARCNSGFKCENWKGKKYDRTVEKQFADKILNNIVDLDHKYSKVVDDNFLDLT